MKKKPKTFFDALSEWFRNRKKRPEKKEQSAKEKKPSLRKKNGEEPEKVERLPRSIRRKKGYWKLFFYSFGIVFILSGLFVIGLFVVKEDPSLLGIVTEYNEKAKALIDEEKYEEAREILEKSRSIDPKNADTIILLADIFHNQQRYSSEIDLLKDGIRSDANSKNIIFYRRIVQAYVAQDRIEEACQFCTEMDSYMQSQMSMIRPDNIQASTDQGVYASAVTIRFTVPENSTVYYTTDGSCPDTKNAYVYSEESGGIVVNKGVVTVRAVAVSDNGLVSNLFSATYRIYNDNTPYEFLDVKVEQIVRALLNRSASDRIYYKDLSKITEFTNEVAGIQSSEKIRSLEDLAVLANLNAVHLIGESEIEDFTVLKQCPLLKSLTLEGVSLSDSTLSQIFSLTSLTKLEFINNGLYNIAGVSALSNLTSLNLSDNFITDISSLAGLENLQEINLSNNRITDLSSLSSIPSLLSVNIAGNTSLTSLKGISLLPNVETLVISNLKNVASLTPISEFQNLKILIADGSGITSLAPLVKCSKLSVLSVSNTTQMDFDVLRNVPLISLTANFCELTDVSGIAQISSLVFLEMRNNNGLTTIAPIAGCKNLQNVNVSGSPITDMEALLNCESLSYLECEGCTISSAVLLRFSQKNITVIS